MVRGGCTTKTGEAEFLIPGMRLHEMRISATFENNLMSTIGREADYP